MPFQNDILINMMKMHAASQAQSYSFSRIGWVKDYDPTTNNVKVGYFNINTNDWDLMSGWLPIVMPSLGKGDDSEAGDGISWGFVHPPNINEQVVVISQNGDFTNGYIIGALYSDVVPPPNPDGTFAQMGEFLWCHKTGTYVKFLNNGDLFIYVSEDYDLHVKNDGKILIEGNATLEVTGNTDVYVGGEMTAAVTGAATVFGNSVTANTGGNATVQAGGNISAIAAGNLLAEIGGSIALEANGSISLQSHAGGITLDALSGINFIARGGNIISLAGGTITGSGGDVIPPLPALIIPAVPTAPTAPVLFPTPTPAPTPTPTPTPTPAPPSGPNVGQGSGPGVTNVSASNAPVTDAVVIYATGSVSINLTWNAPAGSVIIPVPAPTPPPPPPPPSIPAPPTPPMPPSVTPPKVPPPVPAPIPIPPPPPPPVPVPPPPTPAPPTPPPPVPAPPPIAPTPNPTPPPTPAPPPVPSAVPYGTAPPSTIPLMTGAISPLGWTVDFFDDFDGTFARVDNANWYTRFTNNAFTTGATYNGNPATYGCLWANNWGGYYTGQIDDVNNITMADSVLSFAGNMQSGVPHTASCVMNMPSPWGLWEWSFKCAGGADGTAVGVGNGIWLSGSDWPCSGEFDITETFEGDAVNTHIHISPTINVDGPNNETGLGIYSSPTLPGGGPAADGKFHVYSAMITPEYIALYIDGALKYSSAGNSWNPSFLNNITTATNPPYGLDAGSFGYLANALTGDPGDLTFYGNSFLMIMGVNVTQSVASQFPFQAQCDWFRHSALYPASGGPHV